jgi:nitrate reductase gamma subunit
MKKHILFFTELLIVFVMVNPAEPTSLIDPEELHVSLHGRLSCLDCHHDIHKDKQHADTQELNQTISAFFEPEQCTNCHDPHYHTNGQDTRACRSCHLPHDEKIAHDAHMNVACEACHLRGAKPVKDMENNRIIWHKDGTASDPGEIHNMLTTGSDAMCGRCHFKDNDLGVSAKALPAKTIICMPCHTATFSISDVPTIIALLIFMVGFINLLLIWFSGRPRKGKKSSGPGLSITRIFKIMGITFFDVLLQRRLFHISRTRWFIHGLIFYPILLRFMWGLVSLLSSLWFKEWPGVVILLDKNHPITALLFDATGLMVIIGVILMMITSRLEGSRNRPEGLPARDWPAYGLLAGIFVAGFILEGTRISMTGASGGGEYAFLGYTISRLFTNMVLNNIYAYFWYVHAILTAAFVAYLPFSRMLHVIIAPISMAVKAFNITGHS